MRHRVTAIFLLILLAASGIQSLPAQTHSAADNFPSKLRLLLPDLTEAEFGQLLSQGELTAPYGLEPGGEVSVRFAPAFERQMRSDLKALDPRIGVEVLFLVDAPRPLERVDAELLETLQAISTMEGIEYYSASRDRMRILFHESYAIAGTDDRTRIPDPDVHRVSAHQEIHIFQRDSSFGSNVLRLSYSVTPQAVRVRMQNLTQMYYMGFIPAVGPRELALNMVVYPLGEKLLFYGNSAANPLSLLGMEARVQRSFYNRLVALYEWFITQV